MSLYDRRRKRILKRFLSGLTLFIVIFFVFGLTHLFFGDSLPDFNEINPFLLIGLIAAIAAIAYQPIDQGYHWLFKHILFPRRPRVILLFNRLSQELALTTDLGELANLLVNTLGEVFQLKTISLLIRAPKGEGYAVAAAYGWNVADYRRLRLQSGSPLLELLNASGPQVLLREKVIRALTWQEANKLTTQFETLHATCLIPLWVKNELVGAINLLTPPSEENFDEGDIRLFRDFAEEIAPSVRNALMIQELKSMNEELRDTQSKLLQNTKLAAIEQLATGIAHEIHNPLTIISGKAQVLLLQKDRKPYDEKVEEMLQTIVKQTKRAADITRKLLMFSRGSASSREKLRLETVLEDTLSLIAYQTSLEGIEIRRLVGQDLPDFFGNVQELREVFFNLILNALQATGPGGQLLVGITFQKSDKIFTIQIADNGPGIPPENRDQVFNPFFTTQPERLGLGLFVTQQIVHRYGGLIRVESEPGEGTLFAIELPLEIPAAQNLPELAAASTGGKEIHDPAVGR